MSSNRNKLFIMMVLQFFIWGAWLPLIFAYLPALKLTPLQQTLILWAFPVAAVIGLFLVSGAATSVPMTTLPRRAARDLRWLVATPIAIVVAVLFVGVPLVLSPAIRNRLCSRSCSGPTPAASN